MKQTEALLLKVNEIKRRSTPKNWYKKKIDPKIWNNLISPSNHDF